VNEVEEASNNEQNPEADGATGGTEETQPRTQEEGKEDSERKTGSTGDPNLMEASVNENVVALSSRRSSTQCCTIH